jgi:hypothetical protein
VDQCEDIDMLDEGKNFSECVFENFGAGIWAGEEGPVGKSRPKVMWLQCMCPAVSVAIAPAISTLTTGLRRWNLEVLQGTLATKTLYLQGHTIEMFFSL